MSRSHQQSSQGTTTSGLWRDPSLTGEGLTWGDANPDLVGRAIESVTEAGHAVIFGRTQDGTALSITVLAGDDRSRLYPHTREGVDSALQLLAEWAEGQRH